jgi:hypothetical protein
MNNDQINKDLLSSLMLSSPPPVVYNREPNEEDLYKIGQLWFMRPTYDIYMLIRYEDRKAIWECIRKGHLGRS